jgi:hypothetical protein
MKWVLLASLAVAPAPLAPRAEQDPALFGRVLSDADGALVAGALIAVRYRSANGLEQSMGATSDEHGSFRIALSPHEVNVRAASLALDVTHPASGLAESIALRDVALFMHLGDVRLRAQPERVVEVVGPDGRPIEGARVRFGAPVVLGGAEADAAGRAVLRGVPPAVERVQVLARGFEAAAPELAPPPAPLRVELWPAAVLEVRVGPTTSAVVIGVALESLFRGERPRGLPEVRWDVCVGRTRRTRQQVWSARRELEIEFAPIDGLVLVNDVVVGVPLVVRVAGANGRGHARARRAARRRSVRPARFPASRAPRWEGAATLFPSPNVRAVR